MPVIAFATSKGGAGKSTLCLLISSELAIRGVPVTVYCTDPQHSSYKWYQRSKSAGRAPENLTVERIDEETDLLRRLQSMPENELALIDVQGAMTQFQTIALVSADVTVVPCKATYMDVVEALKMFEYASNLKRSNLRLVFNEVQAIHTKTAAFMDAVAPIRQHRIPVFDTMVSNRPVYAQFSNNAGTLESLATDVTKREQVDKARNNIARLTSEILRHAGYQ